MGSRRGLTQADFAQRMGLSKGRIAALINNGLPRFPDGSIDGEKASQWIENNLDPKRRQAAKPGMSEISKLGTIAQLRAHKLHRESLILDMELKRKQGLSIDRQQAEAAIVGRARYERDAWIGWASATAAAIAEEVGCDPTKAFGILDRQVREHLEELSATSWELIDGGS